jgi:hypothetical protein
MERAFKDGKHAFVLFYHSGDQANNKMKETFARAEAKLQTRAVFTVVDVESSSESRLIEKYGVRQAPLPLTMVLAPNGAIVRAFTKPVDEKALAGAFASPKVAEVLKALQGGGISGSLPSRCDDQA